MEKKKRKITCEDAKNYLNDRLNQVNIADALYNLVKNIVERHVEDIYWLYDITDEDADGEEAWFDEIREDFIKSAFEKVKEV
jgi:hypothetical protein